MVSGEGLVFRLTEAEPCLSYNPFARRLNLEMHRGETWLITGRNGSGKTTLGRILAGAVRLKAGSLEYGFAAQSDARYLSFQDELAGALTFHQLKWNQGMRETEEQRVRDVVEDEGVDTFGLGNLQDRPVISLSTGELRRVQLARALHKRPQLLILDDPATGLDVDAAGELWDALRRIQEEGITAIIVIAPRVPRCSLTFTRTIVIGTRDEVVGTGDEVVGTRYEVRGTRDSSLLAPHSPLLAPLVEMKNVTVVYGGRKILNNRNWTIKQGERWLLSGKNGSGKTTLLSLLTADNPNAYGQDIKMWGRKRGSGESIWDIKKRVGYLHAEMHRAMRRPMPIDALVATALHEQSGLYHRLNEEDTKIIEPWMKAFGLWNMRGRLYTELSTGEQHRVLLARTFAKNPELLILDEPFHSLDEWWIARLLQIIDNFAAQGGTLLLVTHNKELTPRCITHTKEIGNAE